MIATAVKELNMQEVVELLSNMSKEEYDSAKVTMNHYNPILACAYYDVFYKIVPKVKPYGVRGK